MKHVITGNMKVWSVNSVAAVMMLCSGSALATGFSQPQTQPFTLEFTQPAAPLTMSLTPVTAGNSALLAGTQLNGVKVADISISSTNPERYGLRFTPGTFTPSSGAVWVGAVKEKSSASTVKLAIDTGAVGNTVFNVGTDTYLVASSALTSSTGFAVLYNGVSQVVAPGVYPISVDVASYTP